MAKTTGFMEFRREEVPHRPVDQRVGDYFEIDLPLPEDLLLRQAARCMDCGVPFCHGSGCPLRNNIPEFNDLIYSGQWRRACDVLHATNNFPEITGRVCPAPCETSCTLGINDEPVLIRHIELQIAERGWAEGWIVPLPAERKTGRRVAVVGSGPAGLACAQQLVRAGHDVTVFEKHDAPGGLLRYGIPDFKLDKRILDRRVEQMKAEGVTFETGVEAGEDISPKYLRRQFDAVCITMGSGEPNDLRVEGRGLRNIHFAMDFLALQNRINAGRDAGAEPISAEGRIVVVIGGGDTGSDCVGTARRQGAKEIYQFEILPKPPESRPPEDPWPTWPRILRTSTSQEEGCIRRWCVRTNCFSGAGDRVKTLHGCEVRWEKANGRWTMHDVPGTEFSMPVDLVLLAMGFGHVTHPGLVEKLGLNLDQRGNVVVGEDFQTSEPGVFAAGDAQRGASLVVHAIDAGRQAAAAIDGWLAGRDA